jgi:hypothetical protein
MKSSTIVIIIVLILIFWKRKTVETPAYVSRYEFDLLKKQVDFLQTDFDNQDFS